MWKDYKFQGKWEGSLPAVSDAPCNFEAFFFFLSRALEREKLFLEGVMVWACGCMYCFLFLLLFFSFRMKTLFNDLKGHRKTLQYFMISR